MSELFLTQALVGDTKYLLRDLPSGDIQTAWDGLDTLPFDYFLVSSARILKPTPPVKVAKERVPPVKMTRKRKTAAEKLDETEGGEGQVAEGGYKCDSWLLGLFASFICCGCCD